MGKHGVVPVSIACPLQSVAVFQHVAARGGAWQRVATRNTAPRGPHLKLNTRVLRLRLTAHRSTIIHHIETPCCAYPCGGETERDRPWAPSPCHRCTLTLPRHTAARAKQPLPREPHPNQIPGSCGAAPLHVLVQRQISGPRNFHFPLISLALGAIPHFTGYSISLRVAGAPLTHTQSDCTGRNVVSRVSER